MVRLEPSVHQMTLERQIGMPWRPGSGAGEEVGPSECPMQRSNMIGAGN